MQDSKVDSVSAYMGFVEAAEREIREGNSDDILLFRGQSVDEPLLPKMARLHLVHQEWGIPQRHSLQVTESRMLAEFKRRARPFLDVSPETEWDWLSLAQHHGMETRLLDWTSNPTVGFFFSLVDAQRERQPVVWIFSASSSDIVSPSAVLDPFKLPSTKFYRPNLISPRIIAQDGWFSIHKYVTDRDAFVPLERNRTFRSRLTKLTIVGSASDHLVQLDLYGVNRAALFPGLDGISHYINWRRTHDNWVHIRMPQSILESRSNRKKGSTSNNQMHRIPTPRRVRKR